MKCTQCYKGELEVKASYALSRGGLRARTRICNKCGYKLQTVEVSRKEYQRQHDLVVALKIAISKYVDEKKKQGQ